MEEKDHGGLLETCGLHPLVGFGVTIIDSMLFAGEGATLGLSIVMSIPVGLALGIASILIKKQSFGDSRRLAVGKGILDGLLTVIPTPLPSSVTLSGGMLGAIEFLRRKRVVKALQQCKEEHQPFCQNSLWIHASQSHGE